MGAADFSGYATKAGLKCSDGRTITSNAFKEQDGATVPLVWQHGHNEPANILGYATLEHRDDGVYCYAYFNDTEAGKQAKALVQHGDITMLSIYANKLVEKSKQVLHGMIREVSLVLSGANPGALIDNVSLQHNDGDIEFLEDEAIIYTGLTLEHEDKKDDAEPVLEHELSDDATLQDIYDSMTEEQRNLTHYMIGAALEMKAESEKDKTASHSDDSSNDSTSDDSSDSSDTDSTNTDSVEDDLEHKEGSDMGTTHNVFEGADDTKDASAGYTLTHSDIREITQGAVRTGSLKAAVEDFVLAHGIDNIDVLFPDAKAISDRPEFDKRRTEWVSTVLDGTRHSPFSRIKTVSADLTFDEARARGYVKGDLKKEEFFAVAKRTTTPTTVYKKQKLDRDDIIDITDFDVVSWVKVEMRIMLDEEVARAILIGDGRDGGDADKIQDGSFSGVGIRPIATEDELYNTTVNVQSDYTAAELIDAIVSARVFYKGTGTPTFFTKESVLTKLLLQRDGLGRRLYRNVAELADELRVNAIVPVEVMEEVDDLVGLIVNLGDYVVGADKGGELNMFDDFDIDYNKYTYLIETRLSGALVKIKAALTIRTVGASAALVVPTEPGFVSGTGVITIPTVTGVTYKNGTTNATIAAGPMTALASGDSLRVYAVPASASYYFATSENDEWTFERP